MRILRDEHRRALPEVRQALRPAPDSRALGAGRSLKALFLHPVFPGQLGRVMETLARDPANTLVHLSQTGNVAGLPGVRRLTYSAAAPLSAEVPPYLHKMHTSVCAATEVAKFLPRLRAEGFVPDITVA